MALMKKLTSAIVASSLVLGLVGTASATTPDKIQVAADRLLALKLIQGVTPGPNADLALNNKLTRAELVTILVRAFGEDSNAKLLNGAAAFPDTADHPWASGYIAMAKRIIADRSGGKEAVGLPDGTFNPNGNVTAAEAVAFLMKFLGAPKDDSQAWPMNYIQGAANAGLLTADDKAVIIQMQNAPATRGLAFYLADRSWYGYRLPNGKTVYTTFVDTNPPALTLDAVAATTVAEQITVSGTVASDAVSVHVGAMDNPATMSAGKFTAAVDLTVGENSILVRAVDLAGNTSEQTVKVTRSLGTVASIEAADITLAAGEVAEVNAVAKDAQGNEISGANPTGESAVGTFAAGKFTAGEKAGEGVLTLKLGGVTKEVRVTVTAGALAKVVPSAASAPKSTKITLSARDKFDNPISAGVNYALTAAEGGTTADAFVDSAQGVFIGAAAGLYTVTATQGANTATVKIGVASTTLANYRVSADATLVANNNTMIKVTIAAVDKFGNVITTGDAATAEVTVTAADFVDANGDGVPTATLIDGVKTLQLKTAVGVEGGHIATINVSHDDKSGSAEIELVEQVATAVKVSAKAKYLANNTGGEVEQFGVTVVDQTGSAMKSGTFGLGISVSGPAKIAYLAGGNVDHTATSDHESFVYPEIDHEVIVHVVAKQGESGTVTLNATSESLTAGSATMIAQTAGAPAKVVITPTTDLTATANSQNYEPEEAADSVEFAFQVTDAQGVPIKGIDPAPFSLAFTVDTAKVPAVRYALYKYNTEGYGSRASLPENKTVTLTADNMLNGGGKIRVYASGLTGALPVAVQSGTLTKGEVTLKFTADKAAKFTLSRENVDVAVTSPTVSLSAQLTDAAHNKVAQAGVAVTLSSTDSDVTFAASTVYTDATGKATFTTTVPGYVTAGDAGFTVKATIDFGGSITDEHFAKIKVVNYVAGTVKIDMKNKVDGKTLTESTSATSVSAGTPVYLTAQLKDTNGRVMSEGQSFSVEATEGKTVQDLATDLAWTYDADSQLWWTTVTPTKTSRLALTVTNSAASTDVRGSDAISVKAGAAATLRIDRPDDAISLDILGKNVAGPFYVRITDEFGNPVAAPVGGMEISLVATPNVYIRTSKTGADQTSLHIAAGSMGTAFYIGTSQPVGTTGAGLEVSATVNGNNGADEVSLNIK